MFATLRKSSPRIMRQAFGVTLILPALIFVIVTIIIPLIWNIILSFQEWDGMAKIKWVMFANYINVFKDDTTLTSFYNSLFIAFLSAIIAIVLGLALALMIYKMGRIEGAVYRLIFFVPSMLPLTIVALLFSFIYNPDIGLLNGVLRVLGLKSLEHAWLAEPGIVLGSISLAGGWRLAGLTMMLCFTAIAAIPVSLFEAARIDGANYFKQVYLIILPMIKPTVVLATMLTLIITFKTYDIVWVMTKGGPANLSRTIPIQMLEVGFTYNEFGFAAAIGALLVILVMVIMFVIKKMIRSEVYEY